MPHHSIGPKILLIHSYLFKNTLPQLAVRFTAQSLFDKTVDF